MKQKTRTVLTLSLIAIATAVATFTAMGSYFPTTIIARSSWRAPRELVSGFKHAELEY